MRLSRIRTAKWPGCAGHSALKALYALDALDALA